MKKTKIKSLHSGLKKHKKACKEIIHLNLQILLKKNKKANKIKYNLDNVRTINMMQKATWRIKKHFLKCYMIQVEKLKGDIQ